MAYRSSHSCPGEMFCTKKFSEKRCQGRRFAVLEGGYNFAELGSNIKAFCNGFE
nr:hypothetical protein [Candidatus Sigynarchaeota archaeon]